MSSAAALQTPTVPAIQVDIPAAKACTTRADTKVFAEKRNTSWRSQSRRVQGTWKRTATTAKTKRQYAYETTGARTRTVAKDNAAVTRAVLATPNKCVKNTFAMTGEQIMALLNQMARSGMGISLMPRLTASRGREGFRAPAFATSIVPTPVTAAAVTNAVQVGDRVAEPRAQRALPIEAALQPQGTLASMRAGFLQAIRHPAVQAVFVGLAVAGATTWVAPMAIAYFGVTLGAQQVAVVGAMAVSTAALVWGLLNHPEPTLAGCLGAVLGAAATAVAIPAAPLATVVGGCVLGGAAGVGSCVVLGGIKQTVKAFSYLALGVAVLLALSSTATIATAAAAA